ncbi:hypothetical protein OHB35_44525 [Streptomyces phaeochromogenes]|uniref:Uncharacterized protein n=1 Tax=Streptomyces phaeochromogenes TaxID=1923 RepID=A0ABZ1HWG8_STRPH|nr:hypothetical protein [Streptomyces phaeochromogenes]WSD22061.1 hypothetical protein OHB35_44525 [Streptomyces phaeochromogenes]
MATTLTAPVAAAISKLVCRPDTNAVRSATSEPKTATARAPPNWRAAFSTPLATPARSAGTLSSSRGE